MPEVSRFGAAELTWDPDTRFGVVRFVDESGSAGGPEAKHLITALERWVGDQGPFQILVDCTELEAVDAAWRQMWADFFTSHRDHGVIAWFNASPQIHLIVTMFRKGTGVTGDVFANEAEARAYLADLRA
jgi:hypothetical protein